MRLKEIIKKQSNGNVLVIKEIDYQTAKEMCIKNHYSHKWNTAFGKYNYGIFKDNRLLGCAVYGNLMNPNSATKITPSGKVIELNRLWVDDELGKNTETMFISATFSLLRNNTDIEVIQSFADGRLGVGTIYKASSFGYYGFEESLFFQNKETLETQHKVPLENTKRPRLFLKGNLEFVRGQLIPFKVKTYRYLFPLRKKVKITMKKLPYPSYEKGEKDIENFIMPIGNMCRVMIMFEQLGMQKECYEIESYLKNHYNDKYLEEKEKQKLNGSYLWFVSDYKDKEGLVNFIRGDEIVREQQDEQLSLF